MSARYMRKVCFGVFLTLSLLFFPLSGTAEVLRGRDIQGSWREERFDILLEFGGGRYSVRSRDGERSGRFSILGKSLFLRDSATGERERFGISEFDSGLLVLNDSRGAEYRFKRNGGKEVGRHEAMRLAGRWLSDPPLAAQGEKTLTRSRMDSGIDLLQFIIGGKLQPAEVVELTEQTILDFRKDPEYVVQQLESIGESMRSLRSLSDPLHIGLARQELFSALYKTVSGLPESETPLFFRIMRRYIKVLASDSSGDMLLTDRDARAAVRYLAFMSELTGHYVEIDDAFTDAFIADIAQQFPSMPLEMRQFLCSAGLIWLVTEANWNSLSSEEREALAERAQEQRTRWTNAELHPSSGAGERVSAADTAADLETKRLYFQTMMNMNTLSHATSLNIIENIGGTGDYWKVVDY